MELVVAILRDVFDLPDERARETMLAVHKTGHAVVGRFAAELAKTKLEVARNRARAQAAPLWMGVEVC